MIKYLLSLQDRFSDIPKVHYKKGSIGIEAHIPRNHKARIKAAKAKRLARNSKRLATWTGLRD